MPSARPYSCIEGLSTLSCPILPYTKSAALTEYPGNRIIFICLNALCHHQVKTLVYFVCRESISTWTWHSCYMFMLSSWACLQTGISIYLKTPLCPAKAERACVMSSQVQKNFPHSRSHNRPVLTQSDVLTSGYDCVFAFTTQLYSVGSVLTCPHSKICKYSKDSK